MGVSTEIYRCRIGLFYQSGPISSFASKSGNSSFGLLLQMLCASALFYVLLVGGIELNPGPDHNFKICKASYSSNSSYFHHMKLHESVSKKIGVQCSRNGCGSVLSTVESLNTHMSKFHSKQETPQGTSEKLLKCPAAECQQMFVDFPSWKKHAESDHLSKGVSFKCIFNCKYLAKTVSNYRTHLSRFHPASPESHFESLAKIYEVPSHDEMDWDAKGSNLGGSTDDLEGTQEEDPYPTSAIIDRLARFYLTLEATHLLPTSTVQVISEEIALFTRLSHHRLKLALKEQLENEGVEKSCSERIISSVFRADPVFNVHHKGHDSVQFRTDYFRSQFWQKNFKFVSPVPVDIGQAEGGKKQVAHLIPIRQSLEAMLEDERVLSEVVKSFSGDITSPEVLADFVDGTHFRDHVQNQHRGTPKCIQILLFQDGFDPNAFSTGNYKPIGFYYTIGNIPPERRSNLNMIQLAYMVLEKDLKTTEEEELRDKDKLKLALGPLIEELKSLRTTGVLVKEEVVPVCLMFMIGDSLGQNYIANIVRNFSSAEFSCRFCPMANSTFRKRPWEVLPLRTPQHYDSCVARAKTMWSSYRKKALSLQEKRKDSARKQVQRIAARSSAPSKRNLASMISKTALTELLKISYRGVKYRPCPFNDTTLQFHIAGSQPPCISHDLHEGIFKVVVPRILNHFIKDKNWFDLKTLNSRIVSFQCQGSDALDRPKPLKNVKSLAGHAVENWNLVRLLPFIIDDLIVDKDDVYWQIFLQLKEVSEFVSAPRISKTQINVLEELIRRYLRNVKDSLKKCLIPKHHYLCHYPSLILLFGPLIRLFTLRFESKHAFFKRVMRSCNNFINVTFTMSRKYMCRAALDRTAALIPDHILLLDPPYVFDRFSLPQNASDLIPLDLEELKRVKIYGTLYQRGLFLVLGGNYEKLKVGKILRVLWNPVKLEVLFLIEDCVANKIRNGGYYEVDYCSSHQLIEAASLPDYQPLPAYNFQQRQCLTLKHTAPFMHP